MKYGNLLRSFFVLSTPFYTSFPDVNAEVRQYFIVPSCNKTIESHKMQHISGRFSKNFFILPFILAQVRTKKKEFLEQIDRIVPWGDWIALICPHYYNGERGNKLYDLERMLRIYVIQNLYNLSEYLTSTRFADTQDAITVFKSESAANVSALYR